MFLNFNDIFHPTEEQKRKRAGCVNAILRENLKNNGECCCNCKHMYSSYIGLDIILPRCKKTNDWIREDIKCEDYEFRGFIEAL